jgi:hypothetical protein
MKFPMSQSIVTPQGPKEPSEAHHRHEGFIVFCETKLCYEKGLKAWLFLGPYLLGALALEMMITNGHAQTATGLGPWIGFLAYLVLFPLAWRRILKFVAPKKATLAARADSSAIDSP